MSNALKGEILQNFVAKTLFFLSDLLPEAFAKSSKVLLKYTVITIIFKTRLWLLGLSGLVACQFSNVGNYVLKLCWTTLFEKVVWIPLPLYTSLKDPASSDVFVLRRMIMLMKLFFFSFFL